MDSVGHCPFHELVATFLAWQSQVLRDESHSDSKLK